MKQPILFSIALLFFSACLKLDNNLYNNQKKSEYELDNYTGDQDFKLDASYTILPDKITFLQLNSKVEGESEPVDIHALYIGDVSTIQSDTVILYCHGNKWHMDFYWQRAKLLAHVNGKNRYGVMMMDYRGFGQSKGKSTEKSLAADADACLSWLKEKGLSGDRLVIYGFSMGSIPACELAANPGSLRPSRLFLEAPIGSTEIMAQDGSQLNMPAAYFTDLKINNTEKIKAVTQPLVWIHGNKDDFLNYKTHGEMIFNNHTGQFKQKFIVEGADHGEVPEKMGFLEYLKVVGEQIRR